MKAQIEIMGLLVIVIVLISSGMAYLLISNMNTGLDDLSQAEKRYLSTFTTVLSETNTCPGSSTSIADAAAATLYDRSYSCGPYSEPADIMQNAVNKTILNQTLDYQFGNQSYIVIFDAMNIDSTIQYRSCPPINEANRRASTQPLYTEYGGMRITLVLCTE